MAKLTFISTIIATAKSLWVGIGLTTKHFFEAKKQRKPLGIDNPNYFAQSTGLFTTLYPHEAIPIPDNGRNRLHNEIDDCIVCDLCAKICPVDCIDIEPIKSTEEIGKTSDGSAKRLYAAKFDIDMAKCCYCGLCTTVCPTECLTMTNAFDYSEFDVRNMIYNFTDLSPAQAEEKRKIYQEAQRLKAEAKAKAISETAVSDAIKPTVLVKPAFKPVIKAPNNQGENLNVSKSAITPDEIILPEIKKTAFKPVIKSPVRKNESYTTDAPAADETTISPNPSPKPVFKPIIKPPTPKKPDTEETSI